MSRAPLKVVELFAGVGGFRLGLEGWKGKSASTGYKEMLASNFNVVWSNQWEPGSSKQHASSIYEAKWKDDSHVNDDISKISTKDIPDHDLLVGGFPCQDYSVARVLSHSSGLQGKKGVLWWDIHRILKDKGAKKPKFLLLENVDRLLKSPAQQRGRDFAVMLASLSDLGYAVEWRVINAADYGMPQRRRRIFFVGYHRSTQLYKTIKQDALQWLTQKGVLTTSFPISTDSTSIEHESLRGDLSEISIQFNKKAQQSPFENTGVMIDRKYISLRSTPNYEGARSNLEDVLLPQDRIPQEYYLADEQRKKWEYLKGAKNEKRKNRQGELFTYKEGALSFPDPTDKPSRTIITSEGGKAASRSKHVVHQNGKQRRLIPMELERLNMFPDDHTKGASDTKRAFFMGNALVVGVVEKIGIGLAEALKC